MQESQPSSQQELLKFPNPRQCYGITVISCSYYRCFIEGFSKIAGPTFALTKKNATVEWDDNCQPAFGKLKGMLTSVPVLVFPDFTKRFILETDASGLGLGATYPFSTTTKKDWLLQLLILATHCNYMKLNTEYQN